MVSTIAPFAILSFCLSNLFTSFGDAAVPFTGAEVDFLFYGPFTRRSLLGYKILKAALGTAFTTLIFSILLLRYSTSWISCCVGIWLTVQFMQLFAMAVILCGQTIGERAYSNTRRGILVSVALLALLAIGPTLLAHHRSPLDFMIQVHATFAGQILLVPFDTFAHTITASAHDLPQWAIPAFFINMLMLAIVIGLDANYLETAATVSQQRYERRQRARAGGAARMTDSSASRFQVMQLPRWGGAGPIAWRQLIGAVRSSRALLILLILIGIGGGTFIMKHRGGSFASLEELLGAVIWMNMVLISMLKFDFRDELDRLDMLRSLPISPIAVAAAELFTPVAVLTAMQATLLIAVTLCFKDGWKIALPAAAFAVPFNVLYVGIENLLFLMFPLRSAGLIAGDMQLFGRQMVIFPCKFLLLLVALTITAAIGTIGYILGNKSWAAFGVVAWVALSLVALSTIPLLARAYARFDPSKDTPL
jgi:Putative ABC exporter